MSFHLSFVLTAAVLMLAPRGMRGETLVAYSKDSVIYTASAADGGNAKKICNGDDPRISNDGRFLAYTHDRASDSKSKRKGGPQDIPSRVIILRELASGKETTLPSGGSKQACAAFWSPDDQWIAFNAFNGQYWNVAVIHPDGTGFRLMTDQLDRQPADYSLAGWNYHDNAILAQNLETMVQLDPSTGRTIWRRPVKEVTGENSPGSELQCTVSADGKLLVATSYAEDVEFKDMDGPSSYLVLMDFPDGKPRRATPPKFDVASPWLDLAGKVVLLRGFGIKDLIKSKNSDRVQLKTRIYRFEIGSGKLTPLIEGGDSPSATRG